MKKTILVVALLLLAVLIAACAAPEAEVVEVEVTREVQVEVETEVTRVVEVEGETEVVTSRGQGGRVTVLYWQAPSNQNPYLSGGTKEIDTAAVVIEPLAGYNEVGELIPFLAKEIPTLENGGISEDLTAITWELKDGLLWSDGTPVTADDAVFSWQYCTDPDTGCAQASLYAGVANVEAVDAGRVKVTFEAPKPFPYTAFVSNQAPIIQKAQFENCIGAAAQECTDANFMPIGTGPYKVAEFLPNDAVLYVANEYYRDPNKPYFGELFIKGGGDAASAARAVLETGEADYAWNLQVEPEILRAMEMAGRGKLVTAFGTSVERLIVNLTNPDPALGDDRSEYMDGNNPHPFLSDYVVRRALSLAIDRNVLVQVGYGPAGQPGCNIVPAPPAYLSTNNDECLTQNLAEANRILDEAGIVDTDGDGIREKDGVPLRILYQTSTNSVRQGNQALVKDMWSQIGVETELRNIDGSVFFGGDPASPDTYGKFYADIEMFTNNAAGTDLESYMNNWTTGQISGATNNWLGNNIPRWYNEEYDAVYAELQRTVDLDRRAELVIQLNDMIVQDYAMIPLVWRGDVSAHLNTLLGVRMNSWDSELWNIADWTRASQ